MKYTKKDIQDAKKLEKYAQTPQFITDASKVIQNREFPMNLDIWDNGIWDGSLSIKK